MSMSVRGIVRRAASIVGGRALRRAPQQTAAICPMRIPLPLESGEPWKAQYLLSGRTRNCATLTCHASALVRGHRPHPPHVHPEEEILMVLSGEVDLILPDDAEAGDDHRRRLTPGRLVFYPANFPHTLEAVSAEPANYLMFKWSSGSRARRRRLPFGEFATAGLDAGLRAADGFHLRPVFEGRTAHLRKLHCHVTTLAPGGGYDPHVDAHDVAIVTVEGRVETLGRRVEPHAVAFYPAGERHGMRNVGDELARYVVIEFHG